MNDSRISNVTQLKKLLKGTQGLDLSLRSASIEKKYEFLPDTGK